MIEFETAVAPIALSSVIDELVCICRTFLLIIVPPVSANSTLSPTFNSSLNLVLNPTTNAEPPDIEILPESCTFSPKELVKFVYAV